MAVTACGFTFYRRFQGFLEEASVPSEDRCSVQLSYGRKLFSISNLRHNWMHPGRAKSPWLRP